MFVHCRENRNCPYLEGIERRVRRRTLSNCPYRFFKTSGIGYKAFLVLGKNVVRASSKGAESTCRVLHCHSVCACVYLKQLPVYDFIPEQVIKDGRTITAKSEYTTDAVKIREGTPLAKSFVRVNFFFT